jgi:hypothetical protein
MQTREFEIALSTFEKLKERFPALSMNLDLRHAHVDVAMDILLSRVSPLRCISIFKTEMNFIWSRRLSGASGFPAQTLRRSKGTSKRFQGCCLESFAFLSTGAADARSRHTYNDLPIVAGKTSLHGAIYRCSCLGRRRPSRLFRTNPDREYAMLD